MITGGGEGGGYFIRFYVPKKRMTSWKMCHMLKNPSLKGWNGSSITQKVLFLNR
jgi:hypothetical protein